MLQITCKNFISQFSPKNVRAAALFLRSLPRKQSGSRTLLEVSSVSEMFPNVFRIKPIPSRGLQGPT